jgi:flagellin-like hook-associated protein FlgL
MTFTAGSGVQPGASSAAQDTILGSAGQHRLHIIDTSGNGSAGTVSLDGSTPINFTNADGNLLVTNGNGDAVYLDMTAITPNFNGNVDITSNGTMSVDGGVTSTPIAFSANQIAQDSATGQSIFVNTFAVERTGTEIVDHPGTSDAFQTLMQLRDLLRNVNHLSPHDQLAAISNQISNLDQVRTNILDKMGEQSASLQSLDSLQSHLQDMQLAAKKNISELSDVDVSELVVKLQTYQQQLQLSLASFARINSHSLLDFLQ